MFKPDPQLEAKLYSITMILDSIDEFVETGSIAIMNQKGRTIFITESNQQQNT
jgi:hypothetical protein